MNTGKFLLASCALSCAALAQAAPADLQPRTEHGITYVCGGVGLDESTSMKQVAHDYDLMSTFAAQDGSYLADVQVEILGQDGKPLLRTSCDGPMMLVKLPHAGSYRMRAEVGGHAQTRVAQVGGHATRRLLFTWPAAQAGLERPRSGGSAG